MSYDLADNLFTAPTPIDRTDPTQGLRQRLPLDIIWRVLGYVRLFSLLLATTDKSLRSRMRILQHCVEPLDCSITWQPTCSIEEST